MADPAGLQYMLTLVDGSLEYIRHTRRTHARHRHPPPRRRRPPGIWSGRSWKRAPRSRRVLEQMPDASKSLAQVVLVRRFVRLVERQPAQQRTFVFRSRLVRLLGGHDVAHSACSSAVHPCPAAPAPRPCARSGLRPGAQIGRGRSLASLAQRNSQGIGLTPGQRVHPPAATPAAARATAAARAGWARARSTPSPSGAAASSATMVRQCAPAGALAPRRAPPPRPTGDSRPVPAPTHPMRAELLGCG